MVDAAARAVAFLEAEMESDGTWRFWSSGSQRRAELPSDLDDTCCASSALRLYGRRVPPNRELILANTTPDGLFYTWLSPRLADLGATLLWFMASGQADDVDPIVNANAVLYLGESRDTAAAVAYLIDLVRRNAEDGASRYYPDALALYYTLGRAALVSAPSLACLAETVVERILARSAAEGGLATPLQVALAVTTLLTFGVRREMLEPHVRRLLSAQGPDGAWPAAPLFRDPARFYGSAELTTGLCLEALARYASA